MGDADSDDRKVSGPKCHRRARFGINVSHAEQDLAPNHINQFYFDFVVMIATHLARKKFNEGHITDPFIGVVELSQFALWQQQPPEGRGIRFQRQLEHREGQPADLAVQECGFGHDYG